MEELEQVNSDVQPEVSSEPQSTPEPQTGGEQAQAGSPEQKPQDTDNTPFHKHPRWQEMIAERNAEREARSALERKYEELAQRLQRQDVQAKPVTNPLIDRLKGIDPEFGGEMEHLVGLKDQFKQFQDWQKNMELERIRTDAYSRIDKMHDENKVDPSLRDLYKEQIEARVIKNPNLGLKDLPQVYKEVHEKYSKIVDGLKRSTTASYVTDKKSATAVPASPGKGKPVDPAKKSEFTGNPEADRAQLISRVMNKVRNSNSL